jgi:hypothetical protein
MLTIMSRSPPAENHDVGFGVIVDIVPHAAQFPMQTVVGGVENVGTVERDQQNSVGMPLEDQVLVLVVFHKTPHAPDGDRRATDFVAIP